ncbi:hypothetical protein KR222_010014 [Zaprionus bogoriensis]|nr:hypothetical protein KR222_010014 [Zaprionus bogoriensis]
MKSNTYELHNYAELHMELDTDRLASAEKNATDSPGARKRKASSATGCRRGEKYSLRQKRQKRTPGELDNRPPSPADELQSQSETAPVACKARGSAKSPAKTKAPPLSKYRRKTANARERTRMREINMAFEQLRHCVPQSISGEDAANTNEKLTKITTLRLAMKYIGMLSESLQDPSYESEFLVECLRETANREAHVSLDTEAEAEAYAEAEPEYEPELEAIPTPPAKSKAKKQPKASGKKAPAKRQSKASKAASANATASSSPESCYASSSLGSPAFCAAACSPSSAYASLSSSASSSSSSRSSSGGSINGNAALDADSLLDMRALSELNTLLLESDGESLHCLDPHVHGLLASAGSAMPARGDLPISMHSPLDKPDVELSLRLLDHSADSFDFASDQQPSACISPLASLDSYHPFPDLLHGEFSDIFLA